MDEKEKRIAIKILDRILSNEGITATNHYDGHLQFIYDELKAIQVQAKVKPANGGKEEFINKYCIKRTGIDYGNGRGIKYIQFRDIMPTIDPDEFWDDFSRLSV